MKSYHCTQLIVHFFTNKRDLFIKVQLIVDSHSQEVKPFFSFKEELVTRRSQRGALKKQKMKIYADLKAHAQEREIKPGEVYSRDNPNTTS